MSGSICSTPSSSSSASLAAEDDATAAAARAGALEAAGHVDSSESTASSMPFRSRSALLDAELLAAVPSLLCFCAIRATTSASPAPMPLQSCEPLRLVPELPARGAWALHLCEQQGHQPLRLLLQLDRTRCVWELAPGQVVFAGGRCFVTGGRSVGVGREEMH
jgi:hypothetical protein